MKMLQGEKFESVLKLPDGIEIKANFNNWVLLIPPRNYSYFSTLDSLFDDLLDYKIKLYSIQNEKKDILSLREAIQKAREEVLKIMQSLTTIKKHV